MGINRKKGKALIRDLRKVSQFFWRNKKYFRRRKKGKKRQYYREHHKNLPKEKKNKREKNREQTNISHLKSKSQASLISEKNIKSKFL